MANTFQEVIDKVFNIFVENEQKGDFGLDEVVRKAKSVINRICEGSLSRFFPNPSTGNAIIDIPKLPFLERQIPINWKLPVNVGTGGALAGAIEIPIVDTTNLTSSGYVVCNGNVIKYTGKTATTLTGVTGLVIDLDEGDQVSQTFLISDINVYKPFDLTYFDNAIELSAPFRSISDPKPMIYYTILNYDGARYLSLVGLEARSYWLKYIKTPTAITTNFSVEIDLPGDSGVDIVAPIVAGETLRLNEELALGKEKLDAGYSALTEAATKRARDIKEDVQHIEYERVSIYTPL